MLLLLIFKNEYIYSINAKNLTILYSTSVMLYLFIYYNNFYYIPAWGGMPPAACKKLLIHFMPVNHNKNVSERCVNDKLCMVNAIFSY